jgi:DNA-binding transcriptional ArsR family regulator
MELSKVKPDPAGLRTLSHPTRLKMLSLLRSDGPATATTLATRLGINTGQTSYHLRQLAQHGFVVDDEERGNGRDRWWKAAHQSTMTDGEPADPADREAFHAYIQAVAIGYTQDIQAAVHEGPLLPKPWRDASTFSDYHVRVTAEHAQALTTKLHEIFMELNEDSDDDPDAAEFVFQFQAFPRPGYLGPDEGSEES